jgi:hypothetical protein
MLRQRTPRHAVAIQIKSHSGKAVPSRALVNVMSDQYGVKVWGRPRDDEAGIEPRKDVGTQRPGSSSDTRCRWVMIRSCESRREPGR